MPGVVIAGTHSGCGKTTITMGVLSALKKKGMVVQPFKAGPDFIDAGLHRMITNRPSRNLDLWMCGEDYVKNCFYRYSQDADISIVEGVMGLYDGQLSTSKLAEVLDLPVILIVDACGMAESIGAVVKGFMEYKNPSLIKGIIFNRVASERHFTRLKQSVCGVEVLGYLPRDLNFEIPHRHLGLMVREEDPLTEGEIERLADAVLKHIDVDAIISFADKSMNRLIGEPMKSILHPFTDSPLIAIAYDKAFCFYYEDNLDLLRDAGAEIVTFSPLNDTSIPNNVDAIYIGGGYPELHAKELSRNKAMLESIKGWADSGRPIYAECGGLMYLSEGIHDFDGNFFKMAGVFPFKTEMKKGRSNLGYREIQLKENCILGKKGELLRGHEFHYSEIKNGAEVRKCRSAEIFHPSVAYSLKNNYGESLPDEGFRYKNALASYVHVHFGSNRDIAVNFINFIKNNTSSLRDTPLKEGNTQSANADTPLKEGNTPSANADTPLKEGNSPSLKGCQAKPDGVVANKRRKGAIMENIILIGHGSPKNDANNLSLTGKLLHSLIHPGCIKNCVKVAYLQFAEPGIADAIRECVMSGAKRIIIHPYFLSSGMHVTKDIPEIIKEAQDIYPDREFIYTEPLGIHEKLVHVVMERIHAARLRPEEIEKKSFEIISEEIDLSDLPSEQLPIIKRVIHATADLEFKNTMMFHPEAVRTGIDAIKAGRDILTDVEMVKTGIIKRWLEPFGGRVICNINDEDVVRLSKNTGRTRSEIAVEKALKENNNIGIIAIGNAPTALLKVIELLNPPIHPFTDSPILVVGVPVGFVRALESKALLAAQKFPFITNLSRKGGTPVAVAIVNALLKMSKEVK